MNKNMINNYRNDQIDVIKEKIETLENEKDPPAQIVEILRADIEMETKQFQQYLKQIANMIKIIKVPTS